MYAGVQSGVPTAGNDVRTPHTCMASHLAHVTFISVADPGGVQTPALLFRCPFTKRTYFENMSLAVAVFS